MEKKTSLYDFHVRHGGRMVPFAGYLLPVQYPTGVIAEHMAVRTGCGVFDVSHMGELLFTGKDAEKNVQRLLTNDFRGMEPGRVRYSPACNERGGVVDDVLVCKFGDDKFMLVVNASNKDKDAAWFGARLTGDVAMSDLSADLAQIALQGPKAPAILGKVSDPERLPARYYSFREGLDVAGFPCLVSRTGYTGEAGYEIYCAPAHAPELMETLLSAGEEFGLIPCGLGARDTLRLEASMPLYGHEMDEETSPLETNLGMFVKMEKEDFIGRQALEQMGEPKRTRVGLSMLGRGIAREECPAWAGDRLAGRVTSGTFCPYLGKALAMALVDREYSQEGRELSVDIRGRRVLAEVVTLPFYRRP